MTHETPEPMSPARLLAEKIGNAVLTKMPKGVFEVPGSHMAFVVWCEQIIQAGLTEAADRASLNAADQLPALIIQAKKEAYEQGANAKADEWIKICDESWDNGWKQGNKIAYLDAAKIADELCWKEHGDDNCVKIGEKLRENAAGK